MPSKSFGNSVGSGSGATLTIAFDGIGSDANNGWLINPRVEFESKPGWSDGTNWIEVAGSAQGGRIHSGMLNGGRRSWGVGFEVVPLTYGSTTWRQFIVRVNGISFFNGDRATSTYVMDIEFPARPYEPPNPAPSMSASFVNDNRADLSWTTNYTGANEARPWHRQFIDRTESDNWGSGFLCIAELGWDATSHVDSSIQPNKAYQYRHIVNNSGGWSTHTYAPNPVYTTPAAPANTSATKQANGSIVVTWENRAPWASAYEISDSPDGTTWTVLSSNYTGGVNYTHTSPSTSVTHRYRVRAKTPDGKTSAYSNISGVVQLLAPPNVPTWLASEAAYDASTAITLGWRHNPVDTTPQRLYEARYRSSPDNGMTFTAWTSSGEITSTVSSRTYAANTLPQNRLVELQVRTWGSYTSPSEWSATLVIRTSARPMVGVTSPTVNATYPTVQAAGWLAWSYADAEGTAQSGYQVSLYTGDGTLMEVWAGSGPATTFAMPYNLQNGFSYRVGVRVKDGAGLWSNEAVVPFKIVYLPPPSPILVLSWDVARGAAIVQISNPDPTGSVPAAVKNNIYRDGQLIAREVPVNSTYIDPLPLTTGSTYQVEAISALPSQGSTTMTQEPDPEVSRRFWLNAGAGWAEVVSWFGNVDRSRASEITSVVESYSGRELPVETLGEGLEESWSFSTEVVQADDPPAQFHRVITTRTTKCFREPSGRYFVSAPKVNESTDQSITGKISMDFQTVDFTEGVN